MFFSFDLTVPINTPASAPLLREVTLPPGVVQQVDVQFPSGCVGLVHTLCQRASHQVWPSNDGADFSSNGQMLSWQDDYTLDAAPFVLRLFAWNLDDTYPHTITWRFNVRLFSEDVQKALLAAVENAGIGTLQVDA